MSKHLADNVGGEGSENGGSQEGTGPSVRKWGAYLHCTKGQQLPKEKTYAVGVKQVLQVQDSGDVPKCHPKEKTWGQMVLRLLSHSSVSQLSFRIFFH